MNATIEAHCHKYENGIIVGFSDILIQERKIKILINSVKHQLTTIDSEGLEELCLGFLFQKGYVTTTNFSISLEEYVVSFDNLKRTTISPMFFASPPPLEAIHIEKLATSFNNASTVFQQTAGVHGCYLYSSSEKKGMFYYDISRFNVVLKAIGHASKNIDLYDIIFLSCRINEELMVLLLDAGAKAIITRSAVSYQAAQLAQANHVILIGFARDNRYTVF